MDRRLTLNKSGKVVLLATNVYRFHCEGLDFTRYLGDGASGWVKFRLSVFDETNVVCVFTERSSAELQSFIKKA